MYDPTYLDKINNDLFPKMSSAKIACCGREPISSAKNGDIVIYTGGTAKATGRIIQSQSFTEGKEYTLARDYTPAIPGKNPYFIDIEGKNDENGHISIVADNNGSSNGCNAALFKLKNKD